MTKFLSQYEPRAEDFVGSHVELQSGGTAQVNPHPGYHIMVHLNTKSELLRLVSHKVSYGISLCFTATHIAIPTWNKVRRYHI
jgi:hypothetical protein